MDRRVETAGASLIFHVQTAVTFNDKNSFRDISVSSDVLVRNELKEYIQVRYILTSSKMIVVVTLSWLTFSGKPEGLATPLPNDGYSLSGAGASLNAPLTNEPYSKISGDFNPIHVNPYFSCYA